MINWIREERLRFNFDVIRLWEIPASRVLDTPYVELWPLAGLMADVTVAGVVAVGERIATAPVARQEQIDLTSLLVTLAGLRLPQTSIMEALRRNTVIDELLRESSVARLFIDEGRAEGITEGLRRSVRLVIAGRFGAPDAQLQRAIEQADRATLETVLAHIGSDTLEQARARFGLS